MIPAITTYGFGTYAAVKWVPTYGFLPGNPPIGPGAGSLLLLNVGK